MDNSKKKSIAFKSAFDKAREKGKRVKKETVGGVTHETWEQPDGRRWIFAYYTEPKYVKPVCNRVPACDAENHVADSAEKAENPA